MVQFKSRKLELILPFSILPELLVKAVIATFDPPGVAVAQEEERFGTNWKDGGLIPGSYSLPWTGY